MEKHTNNPLGHTFYTIDNIFDQAIRNYVPYPSEDEFSEVHPREVYVIVPTRNEDPYAVKNTVQSIGMTNREANMENVNFGISGIILSDQSDPDIMDMNQGKLYTTKDVLERTYRGSRPPRIYQLRFGKKTDEIIGDYASEFYGDYITNKKEPRGKGWNMLFSSLTTGMFTDDNVGLVYMDSENDEINWDQVIALGWPLYHPKSRVKFVKSKFDRYHMEGYKRTLGGRVNHATFKPFVDILYKEGIMPKISYPLSGEIAIRRDKLWDIMISRKFGVEWSMLLQLITPLFDATKLDLKKEFAEVYIGLNMDQPLAEGKGGKKAIEEVGDMTSQIMGANNYLIGDIIKDRWRNTSSFMKEFNDRQKRHMSKWSRMHGNDDDGVAIAGGIDMKDLKSSAQNKMKKNIEMLYNDKIPSGELLAPLSKVREEIGESDFSEFMREMKNQRVEIR